MPATAVPAAPALTTHSRAPPSTSPTPATSTRPAATPSPALPRAHGNALSDHALLSIRLQRPTAIQRAALPATANSNARSLLTLDITNATHY